MHALKLQELFDIVSGVSEACSPNNYNGAYSHCVVCLVTGLKQFFVHHMCHESFEDELSEQVSISNIINDSMNLKRNRRHVYS